MHPADWAQRILSAPPDQFGSMAMELFQLHYRENEVYRQFADLTGRTPERVHKAADIPFLPISLFKSKRILCSSADRSDLQTFESSGTTGQNPSIHLRPHDELYTAVFRHGFRQAFGEVKNYCILGLLPSYLERPNSSLVFMVKQLIEDSGHKHSGFFLNEPERLRQTLQLLEAERQPTLLIGVTFALLDFAESNPMHLQHTIVVETGGMKGRREEWLREEVHAVLCRAFGLKQIASEYGMTELSSQAYAHRDGWFTPSATMKILIRDLNDPLQILPEGRGAINVIDLGNLHTCPFIATEDLGERLPNGQFRVLGRMDQSEWRGCSLMAV